MERVETSHRDPARGTSLSCTLSILVDSTFFPLLPSPFFFSGLELRSNQKRLIRDSHFSSGTPPLPCLGPFFSFLRLTKTLISPFLKIHLQPSDNLPNKTSFSLPYFFSLCCALENGTAAGHPSTNEKAFLVQMNFLPGACLSFLFDSSSPSFSPSLAPI